MKNILKLFASDIKRLFQNFFALVIIIGLCIIPSLYAWFNIYSNWDPYSNTSNIQIAVATEDTGYTLDSGITENMGDEVIDELKDNESIGWVFTDKEDAIHGVEDGTYYAAVVISENFTESMVNVFTDDDQEPTIFYYENEKKNAVATKITDSAVSTLKESINEEFIEVMTTLLMSETNSITEDVQDKDEITALKNKVEELQTNLSNYSTTIDTVIAGNDALQDAIEQADANLDSARADIASGQQDIDTAEASLDTLEQSSSSIEEVDDNIEANLEAVDSNITELESDLDAINNAGTVEDAEQYVLNAAEDAVQLASLLTNIQTEINTLLNEAGLSEDMINNLTSLNNTITQLEQSNSQILSALGSTGVDLTSVIELIQQIETSTVDTSALESQLSGTIETISSNDLQIQTPATLDGIQKAISNTSDMAANMQVLYDNYLEPETNQLETQLNEVLDGISDLLDSLNDGTSDLGTLYTGVDSTIDSTNSSLEDMKDAIATASTRLGKIADKIDEIENNTFLNTVLDFLQGDPDTYAEFFASPVDVTTQEIYPIANYGSAMTPFYTALALWVGGLLLTALIKVKADPKKIPGITEKQLFFGRYVLFFVLGQVQAAIVVLGDVYLLHCQILNVGLFWLTAAEASFVFTLLIYTLTLSFGDVGKALAVVMVVIQIAGSGGTFPIELLPSFYKQIYVFFPFPYAINAMRETIGGAYQNTYLINMLELLLFAVGALLLGLVVRKPFIGLNHFMEKRMEDTKLM